MNCTVIYGGFNPAWRAGKLERNLVDSIAQNLDHQYPQVKKVVAVTSWHEPIQLVNQIKQSSPDITVLCSLTDPLGPIENLIDQIPGKVLLLGYTNSEYFYDFWAVACAKFFKKYNIENIELDAANNLFLNYNRKPHRHRTELIKMFEQTNLIHYGCVTLGNSTYTVGDTDYEYSDSGSNDVIGDVGIPNDVYSLGRLDIWNSSFINVVSETQYEYSSNVFLSEKIFKPIIGLRPFIINGSPGIYRILKKYKFDCFDDLFPVDLLANENNDGGYKFKNHAVIAQTLTSFQNKNLLDIYKQIKPRLLYNQNLFYEYASNQSINFKFQL